MCRKDFIFHSTSDKCGTNELEDEIHEILESTNSCKERTITQSNLHQMKRVIAQNHTRKQGLQLCRRNFWKKTNRTTSYMSLKLRCWYVRTW